MLLKNDPLKLIKIIPRFSISLLWPNYSETGFEEVGSSLDKEREIHRRVFTFSLKP